MQTADLSLDFSLTNHNHDNCGDFSYVNKNNFSNIIYINPFNTSVLVCPSQVQIFMKSFIQPNFDVENSKIESIFPYFSSSFSFLPWLIKNVLKNGSKFFFHKFSWKLPYNLILIWRIQRSNSFSQIFSFTFLFLPRLV